MRQQTLNEERMSHAEEASVRSGERRSSGSKLIISSPTPATHPFINHTTPVSQSTPLSDLNSARNLNQSVQSVGASALLAFLSGSDHRTPVQPANTDASQSSRQNADPQQQQHHHHQQQQQQTQQPSPTQSKTSNPPLPPSILISSRPGQPNDTGIRTAPTTMSSLGGSISSPANPALYSTNTTPSTNADDGDVIDSSTKSSDSSGHLANQICSVSEDSGPSSTRTSDPGPKHSSNLLPIDISTMDLESTVSPVSSDLNSPMESCFPNIAEDQESDSFDLNNITPSIHLSSSFGVPGEFLTSYSRPHPGTLDSDISRISSGGCGNAQQLGLRITQANGLSNPLGINTNAPSQPTHHTATHHHHQQHHQQQQQQQSVHQTHLLRHGVVAKTDEDDLALSKASTSCPAEMHEPLPGFGSSPLQSNTSAYQIAQPSSSGGGGSGGSLGGNSTNDGIPMGPGGGSGGGPGSLLYASPNSLARSCDDQRAAWVRDRTKKDSHNRIERKRRDYINCQISELGNLLPEEMFRDGDCKKNKGSILKNSVEFICLLRSELAQVPDVRKETILAAKVIGQLTKRIQELETLSGTSPGNLEYQRTLQEWLLLHEHNLKNRTTVSPVIKPSFLHRSDGTGRSSSPGLSSLGTEDVLIADTKSVFPVSSLLPGSAPAPSAPLNTCSRLQSPVSGVSSNPRLSASAVDSPLRMMRTRCTSLTVAGTSPFSSAELTHTQLPQQQQQHPHVQPQLTPQPPHQQRLAVGPPLRSVPTTTSQLRGSSLLPKHSRPWPHATQADGRLPNHQLSPQHTLPPQHRRNHLTRPIELLQVSTDQDMATCTGLSASLPVHVNPLLCGLPDRDEMKMGDGHLSHVYSFERDEFLTHLKAEPLSEADSSRASELGYPDAGRSSADQTFPDATTNGIILEPVLHNSGPMGSNGMSSRDTVGSVVGSTSAAPRVNGTSNYVTDMALDSPTQLAFEADEFRFDDVVME